MAYDRAFSRKGQPPHPRRGVWEGFGCCNKINSANLYIMFSVRPDNPATGLRPPSATVVLNRFRTEQGHCSACRMKWQLTDTDLCSCGETQTMSHLLNPVPWQNWTAGYLGYTLRMKTLFRGWPVMVHDTHTRRRKKRTMGLSCIVFKILAQCNRRLKLKMTLVTVISFISHSTNNPTCYNIRIINDNR